MKYLRLLLPLLLISTAAFAQAPPQPAQVQVAPPVQQVQPVPSQTASQGNPLSQYQPNPAVPMQQAAPVQPDVTTYPAPSPQIAPSPPGQPQLSFTDWLNEFRQDAIGQGIRAQTVYYALSNVYPDEAIIEKDRAQPETKMTAQEYWDKLLSDDRIERAREFNAANHDLLRRVSEAYAVRSRFIVALLGIESNYGEGMGKENIINALVTLAYDGRRAEYFRAELLSALHILDQGNIRVEEMRGSWAGAMGYCQFMPSSYLKFAQDFDGDGKIDIWNSVADAAASTANYLHQNGWKVAEGWGQEVKLSQPVAPDMVGTKVRQSFTEWRKLGILKKNGKNCLGARRRPRSCSPMGRKAAVSLLPITSMC